MRSSRATGDFVCFWHTIRLLNICWMNEWIIHLRYTFLKAQRVFKRAIWSLVPLPFLKPAWTSGSSWFTYCWSLSWRILSITFLMSQLVTWGGQSTGVSALALFLPKKCQGWSPSEWTGWISLQSKGLSQFKSINSSALSLHHSPTLTSIHDHRKNHSLD